MTTTETASPAPSSERERFTQALQSVQIREQAFINGEFRDAQSGSTFESKSPISGEVIANVAACDAADVDAAVHGARDAFESGVWSKMAPRERKRIMLRFAELIEQNGEELSILETLDMGKPIRLSRSGDLPGVVRCISYYAEAVDKVYDEIAPTAPTEVALVRRAPLGVVGAVVPWNFPLLMASWKLGPALATGNSVVLKPAEQSPLSALRLGELAVEAGIPEGVLQVVPGFGETAGAALGLHMDVDMITFTGSTEVGKLFLKYAGESNMKRTALECGGKTPHVIMPDCPDLEAAADAAAWGIFYNQGEVCNAGSRLLVHSAIKDEVMERVTAFGRDLVASDPLDEETRLGAIVDEVQFGRVLNYIESGKADGAPLRLGGASVREETGGWYIEPTIFDPVDNSLKIAQEEIFGPVLTVIPFDSEDEAVRISNDSIYGLSAAVWTSDLNTAHRMADRIKAGVVWVNTFDSGDMSAPFGGFKQSGYSRDKSLHAMEKYTDFKVTWIHLG